MGKIKAFIERFRIAGQWQKAPVLNYTMWLTLVERLVFNTKKFKKYNVYASVNPDGSVDICIKERLKAVKFGTNKQNPK